MKRLLPIAFLCGEGSLLQAIDDAKSGDTVKFAPTVTGALNSSVTIYKDLTINEPTNKSASLVIAGTIEVVSGRSLSIRNISSTPGPTSAVCTSVIDTPHAMQGPQECRIQSIPMANHGGCHSSLLGAGLLLNLNAPLFAARYPPAGQAADRARSEG